MRHTLSDGKASGFIIVLLCLFVAGCGNEKTSLKKQLPQTIQENSPNVAKEETLTYQIKKSSYQSGDFIIQYPQLSNMENKTKEKQINDVLKNEVILFSEQYDDQDASLEMDYQIMTETEGLLSIVYTGYYIVKGGMYPTHFLFTTNIEIETGEKKRLVDYVPIDEEFVERFSHAPDIDSENPHSPNEEKAVAVKEFLSAMSLSELMTGFEQGDIALAKDNPYGIYSYFQEDFLVISIQVPHVLGDHAEFQMGPN
jgi:hypothetical protein